MLNLFLAILVQNFDEDSEINEVKGLIKGEKSLMVKIRERWCSKKVKEQEIEDVFGGDAQDN